jgi:hypothetical protein
VQNSGASHSAVVLAGRHSTVDALNVLSGQLSKAERRTALIYRDRHQPQARDSRGSSSTADSSNIAHVDSSATGLRRVFERVGRTIDAGAVAHLGLVAHAFRCATRSAAIAGDVHTLATALRVGAARVDRARIQIVAVAVDVARAIVAHAVALLEADARRR